MAKFKIRFIYLLFATIMVVAGACGKDDPEKIAEKDREKILDYIQKNNIDAIEHESGVFYYIENEGSGIFPKSNSRVTTYYTGRLLNGKIFEGPVTRTINLAQPGILGLYYGIPLFSKGSKGLLFIPSGLGYGEHSYYSGIPTNSVLKYEIEIIDF
jgi:FKBP-type peptidyl-prolyl cis-trans isomerase FkpA